MIKQLVYSDRNKINQLLRSSGTFRDDEVLTAMDIIDAVLSKKGESDYHIFSYHLGSDYLAGYICFGPIPMTEYCFDLYWIAVDSRVRQCKVGTKLAAFMESTVIRLGGRKIYVDTSSTEPYAAARSFYEKQGYAVVCVLHDFYRQGDHKIIFMKELGTHG